MSDKLLRERGLLMIVVFTLHIPSIINTAFVFLCQYFSVSVVVLKWGNILKGPLNEYTVYVKSIFGNYYTIDRW